MSNFNVVRAHDGYARSAAYVSAPDVVIVSAACVCVAYPQVHMLELMARGVERREASRACYELFHELLHAAGYDTSSDISPAEYGRVNCLGMSSRDVAAKLRMPYVEFREQYDSTAPAACLRPEDLDRLVWLLDAVRRVAQGVDLGQAMRQASDYAIGKPRQRRAPADADFITSQLAEGLQAAWWALCQARRSFSSTGPWLQDIGRDDDRPTADHLVRPQPSPATGLTAAGAAARRTEGR